MFGCKMRVGKEMDGFHMSVLSWVQARSLVSQKNGARKARHTTGSGFGTRLIFVTQRQSLTRSRQTPRTISMALVTRFGLRIAVPPRCVGLWAVAFEFEGLFRAVVLSVRGPPADMRIDLVASMGIITADLISCALPALLHDFSIHPLKQPFRNQRHFPQPKPRPST